jgi:hypothetical protein
MSFVLLIILGLSTLIQVNSNITSSEKDLAAAKQNALFALNLAIGDLQNEMGPDQRISATASILDEFPETEAIDGVNNPYWTGSWNSNDSLAGNLVDQAVSKNRSSSDGKPSHFRRWLISTPINSGRISPEDLIDFAKNFSKDSKGATLMVGPGTVGNEADAKNSVYVPRQIISKQLEEENGYAYWIGDEGVKTRVAGSKTPKIETNLEQILNVNNAGSPRLNAIDGFKEVEDISDQSSKILTIGTAQFAFNEALDGNINAFKNKFHSLSAFSRGLMVDVKHGGIRKDLSLLFAADSLPIEYNEEPIFSYDSAEGPYWNYAQRYHNIYKIIRNDGGRNYLNTSDFWDDAELNSDPSQVKYTDLPIPVLARMQVIFTLHKQRNTWNGVYNDEIYDPRYDLDTGGGPGGGPGAGPGGGPGGPGGPGGGGENNNYNPRINLFTDWEPFGGAELTEDNCFLIPDTAEDSAGFTIPYSQIEGLQDTPLQFSLDGEINFFAYVPDGSSVDLYFKFAQTTDVNPDNDLVTETISIVGSTLDQYTIDIPALEEINLFDSVTVHILQRDTMVCFGDIIDDTEDVEIINPILLFSDFVSGGLLVDDVAKGQDNNQEILHLMMTPIFYLWNPYNIEIVMDSHPENQGSYEYFYGPPDIEFTYDGENWIDLNNFGSFQFGLGKELLAFWSSNNSYNRATGGEAFEIPAGEFKYNRIIPTMIGSNPDYLKMQFFDIYRYAYPSIFGDNGSALGIPGGFSPVVANWVQSSDQLQSGWGDDALTGLFTPIINFEGEGRGDKRLKKLVTNIIPASSEGLPDRIITYGPYNFNIRLKNQFFVSRFSLGAGWNNFNPDYDVGQANNHLFPKRLIGALNINQGEETDSRPYHQSTLPSPIQVGWSQLSNILNDNGTWGDIRQSPKIALNVDIRGFTEKETPGKHAFFIDPANTYYYDDESNDTSLALSPFRIYVEDMGTSSSIISENEQGQVGFETAAGDTLYKCVSKELPLIPLLSLTQLDHAPLGRDSDHFAYYSGRRKPSSRWHYESSSLNDERVMFLGKEDRPMAPSFNMATGNSWAHPTIPLNDIIDPESTYKGYAVDRSYLLNETLFDSYFFTGLAFPGGPFIDDMPEMGDLLKDWVNQESKLPNANYLFKVPSSLSFNEVVETLSFSNVDPIDLFDKIANFVEVEGAFNINSTSVESWVAQLSSLRGKSVLYDNSDYGNYNTDNTNLENTPVLSQTIPAEKSLENTGGKLDEIVQNSWSHYRSLEDSQIVKLAQEIVQQIKARGPFLSLSQFFNREISERYPYNLKGTVQTAIDESYVNLESPKKNVASALKERFGQYQGNQKWIGNADFDAPEVFQGDANEGLPGYITQASLMRPLSPILSARSDTFVIRAYGDTKQNGETKAKVWCEAIVQRRIDLVDEEKSLFNAKYNSDDANAFNRRFEVVSFRWLNADEI